MSSSPENGIEIPPVSLSSGTGANWGIAKLTRELLNAHEADTTDSADLWVSTLKSYLRMLDGFVNDTVLQDATDAIETVTGIATASEDEHTVDGQPALDALLTSKERTSGRTRIRANFTFLAAVERMLKSLQMNVQMDDPKKAALDLEKTMLQALELKLDLVFNPDLDPVIFSKGAEEIFAAEQAIAARRLVLAAAEAQQRRLARLALAERT